MSDIIQKLEKFGAALYLLTNFWSDLEPLKWRLRGLAGSLVATRENSPTFEVESLIGEARALLNLALNSGLISKANHVLIDNEFERILKDSSLQSEIKELLRIPENKPERVPAFPVRIAEKRANPAPVIKDKPIKNDRQSTILKLALDKGEIMIKDVVPHIAGVSEKTIQRELLLLVKLGQLKKEGEKRWSRYSLA